MNEKRDVNMAFVAFMQYAEQNQAALRLTIFIEINLFINDLIS